MVVVRLLLHMMMDGGRPARRMKKGTCCVLAFFEANKSRSIFYCSTDGFLVLSLCVLF